MNQKYYTAISKLYSTYQNGRLDWAKEAFDLAFKEMNYSVNESYDDTKDYRAILKRCEDFMFEKERLNDLINTKYQEDQQIIAIELMYSILFMAGINEDFKK